MEMHCEPQLHLGSLRHKVEKYLRLLVLDSGVFTDRPGGQTPELFGAIDAAMIRTVMGENLVETCSLAERQAWADAINCFQHTEGLYQGGVSHEYHTNGNAVSALSVLGMRHRYCTWSLYAPFARVDQLDNWLTHRIDWEHTQWRDSQRFRGGPHMYYFSDWASEAWQHALLDWLDENLEPHTGRWRKGAIAQSLEQHIGGASHIWPIYEHTGRLFPYPEKVIDAILELAQGRVTFGECGSFLNVDALYGIKLMRKHAPAYRKTEITTFLDAHKHWLGNQLEAFWHSNPGIHQVLGLCDSCGILYQLGVCNDTVTWTDHFSNTAFYNSAAVNACR